MRAWIVSYQAALSFTITAETELEARDIAAKMADDVESENFTFRYGEGYVTRTKPYPISVDRDYSLDEGD